MKRDYRCLNAVNISQYAQNTRLTDYRPRITEGVYNPNPNPDDIAWAGHRVSNQLHVGNDDLYSLEKILAQKTKHKCFQCQRLDSLPLCNMLLGSCNTRPNSNLLLFL